MNKHAKSILALLTLIALAIALVTTLVWQLDRVTQEEIVSQFSQRQLLLVEQTATGVQRIFDETRRDLTQLRQASSLLTCIEALDSGAEEETATPCETLQQTYLNIVNTHPIYAQIRYIDQDGQEILGADSDGQVTRIIPTNELRSQTDRDFFVETMNLLPGEVYVSRLEPALGHDQVGVELPTVRLATPVLDKQNRRRGIVIINLFADQVVQSIAQAGTLEGVDAWVLNEHGMEIINVSHPEQVGRNAYEYCQQSGDENLILLAENMLAGRQGTGIYLWPAEDGSPPTKKALAYAPVHFDEQLWSVGISAPYSDVLAIHASSRSTLLFTLASIVCVILAGGFLLLRLEHRRVRAEEQAISAEAIEQRNRELAALNVLAEKRYSQLTLINEVGRLATSILDLDEMMHRVARAIQTGFNYYNVALFLLDESHHEVVMRAVAGGFEDIAPRSYRQSVDEGIVGWVVSTGQSLLANDVRKEPLYVKGFLGEVLTRSELCAPIKLDNEVVGALDVQSIHLDAFEQADVTAMETLSTQIAAAIQNARLYAEVRRRLNELSLLYKVDMAATSTTDFDEALASAAEVVRSKLNIESFDIFLIDEQAQELRLHRFSHHGLSDDLTQAIKIPLGKGITGRVALTGQPLLVSDVNQEEEYITASPKTRAEMCAPLRIGERITGVINAESSRLNAFTEDDLHLLSALARQLAVIIENARLFEETRRRLQEVTTLYEASRACLSISDQESMLSTIIAAAARASGATSGSVILRDEQRGEYVYGATCGMSEETVTAIKTQLHIPLEKGLAGAIDTSGQPVIAADVTADPRWIPYEMQEVQRSLLGVPLVGTTGQPMGVLSLSHNEVGHFDESHARLLSTFANQAAIAIENTRLYAERGRRIAELAALNQIGQAISATLHLDELAELIYHAVSRILDTTAFYIALYDQETDILDYLFMIDEGIREPRQSRPLGQGLSNLIVTTQKPLLIRHFEEEKDKYPSPAFVWGTGKLPPSFLGIPLLVGDKVVGVMSVQSYRPHAYNEDDLELLMTIGSQAAIAIENARLFEETKRKYEEMAALHKTALDITAQLEMPQLLDAIIERASKLMMATGGMIYLLSQTQERAKVVASYNLEKDYRGETLRLGEGVAGRVVESGEPLIIKDNRCWPGKDEKRSGAVKQTAIGVPLKWRGTTIGVLEIIDLTGERTFHENDLRLLIPFANQAAVAIENARLFEAEARRRKEAETLRLAAQALSATLDLQQVFELILTQLQQVVPYDSSSVQILKEDRLEIIGGVGFPNLDELLGLSFPLNGDNPNCQVVATCAPFIVDDAPTIYERFRQEPHARARIHSWLGVPLLFGDRLIGMIALDRQEPGFYTEEHARLALAFAAQAAVAIENARLYAELQARMREMQTILDHVPLSITLLDTEMKYVLVNKFAEEKEGYRLDEIRDQRCHEAWGQARPCEGCPAQLALENGEAHRWEGEIFAGYIAEEVCVPIKDEQGRIQGILNIRQDVTDRRRLQAQLLQSGRLSAAGQLISGVAHELNNPLTSIMGYAELVRRETGVDKAIKADLQKIYEQAERSAHIVRKLLTFARQYPPLREKTDINHIIEQTIEFLSYQLDVDNITVILDLASNLPYTQADVHQLQQAFLNIINNAHQAMKQAHDRGTLTVRTGLVDEGQAIRITFADDGPGMSPDIITRIFDPFFTTKDIGKGTGLGLSICYGIVSEHGGSIWAESEPGQGATFFVELPVARKNDTETKQQTDKKDPLVRPHVPPRRILIIEDELPIAGLLSRILKLEGHTTDLTTDGNQALARIRRAHYNAIICDLKMPGLSGQEFYQRLVEMDSPLVQRIIFITGDVINPETQTFLEKTGRPCISKPFLQEDVLAIVRQIFRENDEPHK
jgi:two-component system NtrC family sensor kinase